MTPVATFLLPWIIGRHVIAGVVGLATLASTVAPPPAAYAPAAPAYQRPAPAYAAPPSYYGAPASGRYYAAPSYYPAPQYYAAPRYYAASPYAGSPSYYARPQTYYRPAYTRPWSGAYAPARGYDGRGIRYSAPYGAYRSYSSPRSAPRRW
jgi:hypothetical protein